MSIDSDAIDEIQGKLQYAITLLFESASEATPGEMERIEALHKVLRQARRETLLLLTDLMIGESLSEEQPDISPWNAIIGNPRLTWNCDVNAAATSYNPTWKFSFENAPETPESSAGNEGDEGDTEG